MALGHSSLFRITLWHVSKILLTYHNYPSNVHFGRGIFVWGGTGTDKACATFFPPIQIMLHVNEDFRYMGKHSLCTLDGPHDLWSIFLNIYTQRGNNHTYNYFQYILVFC